MIFYVFLDDLGLGEVLADAADDLVGFMSFTRQQNDVTLFRVRERIFDGAAAVGNGHVGTRIGGEVGCHLADDRRGRLVVGIVRGQNTEVSIARGNETELGTAHARASADRAKEADQARRLISAERLQGGLEADAVMGVVDDDGGTVRELIGFKATLDSREADGFGDRLDRKTEARTDGNGRQRVVNAELTGEGEGHGVLSVIVGEQEAHTDVAGRTEKRDTRCAEVAVLLDRHARLIATVMADHFGGVGVVGVIYDILRTVIGEERALAKLIIVKVGVLELADMVGREVGKDADLIANAVHTCHFECLRGDFHNERADARIEHLAHVHVQIVAFGRGIDGMDMRIEIRNAVRADVARGDSVFVENVVNEER